MHMLRELLASAEEGRLGRAVAGLLSGEYKVKVLEVPQVPAIRAYVGRPGQAVYAVEIGPDYARCTCPDSFVKGTVGCKHALMLVLHLLAERAVKAEARRAEKAEAAPRPGRERRQRREKAAGA
jgi:hypothetical protein